MRKGKISKKVFLAVLMVTVVAVFNVFCINIFTDHMSVAYASSMHAYAADDGTDMGLIAKNNSGQAMQCCENKADAPQANVGKDDGKTINKYTVFNPITIVSASENQASNNLSVFLNGDVGSQFSRAVLMKKE